MLSLLLAELLEPSAVATAPSGICMCSAPSFLILAAIAVTSGLFTGRWFGALSSPTRLIEASVMAKTCGAGLLLQKRTASLLVSLHAAPAFSVSSQSGVMLVRMLEWGDILEDPILMGQ